MKLTRKTRAYIYRVTLAAGVVAAFYGLLTHEEVAVWSGLAATVLGNGLAAGNSPTDGSVPEDAPKHAKPDA